MGRPTPSQSYLLRIVNLVKSNLYYRNRLAYAIDAGWLDGDFPLSSRAGLPTSARYAVVSRAKTPSPIHPASNASP